MTDELYVCKICGKTNYDEHPKDHKPDWSWVASTEE